MKYGIWLAVSWSITLASTKRHYGKIDEFMLMVIYRTNLTPQIEVD